MAPGLCPQGICGAPPQWPHLNDGDGGGSGVACDGGARGGLRVGLDIRDGGLLHEQRVRLRLSVPLILLVLLEGLRRRPGLRA